MVATAPSSCQPKWRGLNVAKSIGGGSKGGCGPVMAIGPFCGRSRSCHSAAPNPSHRIGIASPANASVGNVTPRRALLGHHSYCVRCIMLTRATFRDDLPKERPPQGRVPTDRLPKYDGVELTFLL